jgi:hypothetical protein
VIVDSGDICSVFASMCLLPEDIRYEIPAAKDLIHYYLEVMRFVIVDGDPEAAVFC